MSDKCATSGLPTRFCGCIKCAGPKPEPVKPDDEPIDNVPSGKIPSDTV